MRGVGLVTALRRLGYAKVRQRGSHVRITTQQGGEHHEVIPLHDPIRTKTLSSIPKSVCGCSDCLGLRREICIGLFRSWILVVRDQSGTGAWSFFPGRFSGFGGVGL